MKMKIKKVLIFWLVLVYVSCTTVGIDARRTSIRSRGKSSSGRSNSQGRSHANNQHQAPAHNPVPPKQNPSLGTSGSGSHNNNNPRPSAPDLPKTNTQTKPIGWNVNNNNNNPNTGPVGPPPAYPGLGHNYAAPNGAPPAYSPNYARPPAYNTLGQYGSLPQNSYSSGSFYQQSNVGGRSPFMTSSYSKAADSSKFYGLGPTNFGGSSYAAGRGPYGGGMNGVGNNYGGGLYGGMGGAGMGGLGAYGYGNGYGYKQKSSFSLGNILTGMALYSVISNLGGFGSRRVHIYDHRDKSSDSPKDDQPLEIATNDTASIPNYVLPPPSVIDEIMTNTTNIEMTNYNNSSSIDDSFVPQSEPLIEKIYYGYGYAYGYENAIVSYISTSTLLPVESSQETESPTILDSAAIKLSNSSTTSTKEELFPTTAPHDVTTSAEK